MGRLRVKHQPRFSDALFSLQSFVKDRIENHYSKHLFCSEYTLIVLCLEYTYVGYFCYRRTTLDQSAVQSSPFKKDSNISPGPKLQPSVLFGLPTCYCYWFNCVFLRSATSSRYHCSVLCYNENPNLQVLMIPSSTPQFHLCYSAVRTRAVPSKEALTLHQMYMQLHVSRIRDC